MALIIYRKSKCFKEQNTNKTISLPFTMIHIRKLTPPWMGFASQPGQHRAPRPGPRSQPCSFPSFTLASSRLPQPSASSWPVPRSSCSLLSSLYCTTFISWQVTSCTVFNPLWSLFYWVSAQLCHCPALICFEWLWIALRIKSKSLIMVFKVFNQLVLLSILRPLHRALNWV